MTLDYEAFEQALTLFHHYSLQNSEAVRQMQDKGVLPTAHRRGFSVFDIGAGQGCLPSLMRQYADTLVLLEPNPRCAEILRRSFDTVHTCLWGEPALHRMLNAYSQGFDLITMSHVLYHFNGLDDIREKIRMALALVKPQGNLAIVLNQPSAPMARIGIGFQLAERRLDEAKTNEDLHAVCHEARFFQELAGEQAAVAIYPITAPLYLVKSRDELIAIFRMCVLNPLSEAPCETDKLDSFIASFLDTKYPALTYPATIPSQDDLIIIRSSGSSELRGQFM